MCLTPQEQKIAVQQTEKVLFNNAATGTWLTYVKGLYGMIPSK
jgi:hypothetical protein